MSARKRIAAAVEQPVSEWVGSGAGTVDDGPRNTAAVFSVRMPAEWTDEIIAEIDALLVHPLGHRLAGRRPQRRLVGGRPGQRQPARAGQAGGP